MVCYEWELFQDLSWLLMYVGFDVFVVVYDLLVDYFLMDDFDFVFGWMWVLVVQVCVVVVLYCDFLLLLGCVG